MLAILMFVLACGAPPSEFTCTCDNSFSFDGGSDTETEYYSEVFYCYEDEEATAWVDEEVELCEEYASDADSYVCECTCDDSSKCS